MNETNRSAKHYDLVVIGSGAAGHHGAIQAAKLGKKVLVVERSKALGGASINTGTIPSKTLREAVLRSTRSGSTDRRISASNAQRIEEVASNEVRVFESQFRRNDIDVLIGTASFSGPHTIRVCESGRRVFLPSGQHIDRYWLAAGRTREGRVVLERTINGDVRFFGSNLRATHNLARNIAETIKESAWPSSPETAALLSAQPVGKASQHTPLPDGGVER